MLTESWRKVKDESYDWWSAEGDYKLVGFTHPLNRTVAIAMRWHEYFLWKPIAKKVHPIPLLGKRTDQRAYQWDDTAFREAFFEGNYTFFHDWGKGAEFEDDVALFEDFVGYTILFERAIQSPYTQELGLLQSECEELVHDLRMSSFRLTEAQSKLRNLLSIGKSKAKQQKQEAEDEIAQLSLRINQILARVNEIRAVVLGE